jgi:hypothetical protein
VTLVGWSQLSSQLRFIHCPDAAIVPRTFVSHIISGNIRLSWQFTSNTLSAVIFAIG